MKKLNIVILSFLLILYCACKPSHEKENNLQSTETIDSQIELSDSVAIKNTLHGFFNWYDLNFERLGKIKFVSDSTDQILLDENKLQLYLAEIKKSGFVSDDLIEDEKRFYRACAIKWKKQAKNEIPEGLQADRFYCALDYIAPYSSGNVSATIRQNKAFVVLSVSGHKNEKTDFRFEMIKENGKWLLSKSCCNFGIVY